MAHTAPVYATYFRIQSGLNRQIPHVLRMCMRDEIQNYCPRIFRPTCRTETRQHRRIGRMLNPVFPRHKHFPTKHDCTRYFLNFCTVSDVKSRRHSAYGTDDSTYNWQYRKIPQNSVLGPFWPVRIFATKFHHAPSGLKMHDENRARSGPYHIAHEIPPANSDFEFAESIFGLRFRIYSASL